MPREDDIRRIVAGGRSRGLPDDQIRSLVQRYDQRQQPQATDPPAAATAGMMAQSTVAGDPVPPSRDGGFSKLMSGALSELAGTTPRREGVRWGTMRPDLAEALDGAEVMGSPMMPLAAGGLKVARSVPRATSYGFDRLIKRPLVRSQTRAAQNMQAASEAAKDVPVRTGGMTQPIARAKELQGTGSRMPRVVTQLQTRINQAAEGNLSFREAADFVSSMSRMSVNERNALNPQMHRQVIAIRDAVRQALTESAETVGKGAQYTRGVSEYARAARAAERWEKLKPAIVTNLRRIGYGALGYKGIQSLSGE